MSKQSAPNGQIDNRIDPEYFEKNIGYYTAQYEQFKNLGRSNFNWAAFFFTGWWFLYRRLYVAALIFLILSYVPGVGFIVAILAGIIANKTYFEDAENRLAKGDRSASGINSWVPALAAAIIIITLVLIAFAIFTFVISATAGALSNSF